MDYQETVAILITLQRILALYVNIKYFPLMLLVVAIRVG